MEQHLSARKQVATAQDELSTQASLFREVQKRLLQVVKEASASRVRAEGGVEDSSSAEKSDGANASDGLQGLDALLETAYSQVRRAVIHSRSSISCHFPCLFSHFA